MKKNRCFQRALALLSITAVLSMTVSLAAEPGTDKDPLVTLSYLNETFMDSVLQKVDQKIAARNSQIAQQLGGQAGGTAPDHTARTPHAQGHGKHARACCSRTTAAASFPAIAVLPRPEQLRDATGQAGQQGKRTG